MQLEGLLEMSNRYGRNVDYVLAGGGNTSYKEDGKMNVKGSATRLSDITIRQFVGMDVEKLRSVANFVYPDDTDEDSMEALALDKILKARLPGNETKNPSIEAILHALFEQKYVLHIHPSLVNGMTCGKDGERICEELFGGDAAWIGLVKPGVLLAQECVKTFSNYYESKGKRPQLVFMKNHGVFVSADSVEEIDIIFDEMWKKLQDYVNEIPDFDSIEYDQEQASQIASTLKILYSYKDTATAIFCTNKQVRKMVSNASEFGKVAKPFSPDHLLYFRDEALFIESGCEIKEAFAAFENIKGYKPKIVAIQGLGFLALGKNKKEAGLARLLFLDAIKVAIYAKSFGGAEPLTNEFINSMSNWELGKYRSKA